jgi:monoamine oxidase
LAESPLFGFVPPPHSAPPTVTTDQILTQLRLLFGEDAPAPPEIHIRDWRAEQDTSPDQVESLQAYETFGHPAYARAAFNGRLHWASTETVSEASGNIEGAIAAGKRAASAVLADVGSIL